MSPGWVAVPEDSDFPLENLPYGIFRRGTEAPHVGVAIGDHVLDLAAVLGDECFREPSLNSFMAQGQAQWRAARARLVELLTDPAARPRVEPHLHRADEVVLSLPFEVGDYVDFYASEEHASNLGRIFRPDSEPLPANWKHLPIGYHGRSGTVVVSGTPVARPNGQRKGAREERPTFGPTRRLDIEAEVGFVVGVPSTLGTPVPAAAFPEHVFGVVLVNDWSARDVQAFEYVPLGPFLGKSFATSISPWVVPLDALREARLPSPPQDPIPLDYLQGAPEWALDIELEVRLNGTVVSRPPFSRMYWTAPQQLAHMTANGASIRTGDLFASGTVSGARRDQCGSLIELTWNASEPLELADGSTRGFLEDGDVVSIRGSAPGAGDTRLGFGEVSGRILPSS